MVFLFVSVALLVKEQEKNIKEKEKNKRIKEDEKKAGEQSKKMYKILDKEFRKDLEEWDAKILKDGTIRFQNPKIMFKVGSDKIKNKFKRILKNFCPRYIDKIKGFGLKYIHEIRIAGHTSSEWKNSNTKKRHMENAKLSIRRAWQVHKFCYHVLYNNEQKSLFSKKTVTTGANFVHTHKKRGKEKRALSRRVEFKAHLKIIEKINEYYMGNQH